MIILIDIGNSRIKWASYSNNNLCKISSLDHDINKNLSDIDSVLTSLIQSWGTLQTQPSRIIISNVAGDVIATELNNKIWDKYQLEPEFLKSSKSYNGLKNGYTKPELFGIDRWLSMIGAYNLEKEAAPENQTDKNINAFCVIDCGTAITIDVVNNTGKHLGGFITPGVSTMERSLFNNTSQIKANIQEESLVTRPEKLRRPKTTISFLGRNTKHAIVGGIYYSVAAYLQNIIEDLETILDTEYKVYLTGGDASRIMPMLNLNCSDRIVGYELNSDLIWHGMLSLV